MKHCYAGLNGYMERTMAIRLAEKRDLSEILKIYEYARNFMAENGNPNQWGNKYPLKEDFEADIEKKQLYVCETELENAEIKNTHMPEKGQNVEQIVSKHGRIYAAFAFVMGDDPTYAHIEGGTWKSKTPYGTIHRLAGNGKKAGVFEECVQFCKEKVKHLRADTHADNRIMQHCLEKQGFEKRGIIYVENGTPRIAYEWLQKEHR